MNTDDTAYPMPTPDQVQAARLKALRGVPDGWKPLVDELFDRFPGVAAGAGPIFWEKWGCLRCRPPDESRYQLPGLDEFLEEMDVRSSAMCEVCGAVAWLRPTGWRRTLCDVHTPPEALEMEKKEGTRPSEDFIRELASDPLKALRYVEVVETTTSYEKLLESELRDPSFAKDFQEETESKTNI